MSKLLLKTPYTERDLREHWSKQKNIFSRILRKPLLVLLLICLALISLHDTFYNESYWKGFYEENYPTMLPRRTAIEDFSYLELFQESAVQYGEALVNPAEIENINLNIEFQDWQRIRNRRNELLTSWVNLSDEPKTKVTIDWRDRSLQGKIRLKGLGPDHRAHESKWSFAVNLKSDQYFDGMSEFALQDPLTRVFQYECIYNKILLAIGALAPRCSHVRVSINGEDIGLMTVIERMTKELLESSGRKEGNIFKIYDGNIWETQQRAGDFQRRNKDEFSAGDTRARFKDLVSNFNLNRFGAPLETFNDGEIEKSEELQRQKKQAIKLFNGVLGGSLQPSEIFDVELMGKALATAFLWGNIHPFAHHNLRYYFNPMTYRFEVIPTEIVGNWFDTRGYEVNIQKGQYGFAQMLVSDPEIRKSFRRYFKEFGDGNAQSLNYLSQLDKFDQESGKILRSEYHLLPSADFTLMRSRRYEKYKARIESETLWNRKIPKRNTEGLLLSTFDLGRPIYAYLINEANQKYLQINNGLAVVVNLSSLSVSINGVEVPLLEVVDQNDINSLPIAIPPTYIGFVPGSGARTGILRLPLKGIRLGDKVEIKGTVRPTPQTIDYSFVALPYASVATSNPILPQPLPELLAAHPFLELSTDKKMLLVQPGEWSVTSFIKPPEGIGLSVPRGTTLSFDERAGMLVRGHVEMVGTDDAPITLKARDPNVGWAGLTVMKANYWSGKGRSTLDHVNVYNTNNARYQGWHVTGAITFYKSDVDLRSVVFDGTLAEDALNVVHSDFTMNSVNMSNTTSDGFDCDFVTGSIDDSTFDRIGGDGIDFSGSVVKVTDSSFTHINDKAISVGEASNLDVTNVTISNTGTGLAVKDGSHASIRNSSFDNITHSTLMAYTKKLQYGGATLVSENNSIPSSDIAVIAQKRSTIHIDDKLVSSRQVNIDALYEEGYMKK